PEDARRTYVPDNDPIRWSVEQNTLTLEGRLEESTGIQKTIRISAGEHENEVHVAHRLRNAGSWPIQTAAWALSVMEPGGRAILPQEPFSPHPDVLAPARPLVLWPYTHMRD